MPTATGFALKRGEDDWWDGKRWTKDRRRAKVYSLPPHPWGEADKQRARLRARGIDCRIVFVADMDVEGPGPGPGPVKRQRARRDSGSKQKSRTAPDVR